MTKREVLEILCAYAHPLTPDAVRRQLRGFHYRCSVYSYLFRLHKQGLLRRTRIQGRIAYAISPRGMERLAFLKSRESEDAPGMPSDITSQAYFGRPK